MPEGYKGRGAWAPVGGTLKKDPNSAKGNTIPGPYYMKAKGTDQVSPGVVADDVLLASGTPDLNEHAVWFGVLAIKKALQELGYTPDTLILNGRWGPAIVEGTLAYQADNGLTQDGIIGPKTAKVLFLPWVKQAGDFHVCRWEVASGIVQNESAWDPGAVGGSDSDDHGLCQLNAPAQKFGLDQSFDPKIAIGRLYEIMDRNLVKFGNERDALASYNLGTKGCQDWIAAGRPSSWVPVGAPAGTKPRDVNAYIDRILSSW